MKMQKMGILSAAALAVGALGVSSVFANSITTPTGLTTASEFYVVFITNTTTDATNAVLSHYDNIAQTDADNNGLGTYNSQALNWRIVGSSSSYGGFFGTAAVDRMPDSNIPVYLPDGTLIANSVSDLWSTGAQNDVNEAADGTTVASNVWTGTTGNGTKASSPFVEPYYDFTLGNGGTPGNVEYGNSSTNGTGWIDSGATLDPATMLPIYAFAGINVPAAVPLPSSAAMGAVGLGLLGAYSAVRKWLKLRVV